jgi:hypothetical protein
LLVVSHGWLGDGMDSWVGDCVEVWQCCLVVVVSWLLKANGA